ncbi:CAP domain-containing protein [Oscillatoria sp. CS-180]|uniref:CAP domain-containing protein n=1 Tax=Oscillatoria sp. CS-180 TaxID=3021720 RepID=UPI00232CAF91|nr:CAP domain-containing protein [Oscillatoria sp. CS-180]MDB9527254.1 CAP domain-containing protein [Oscillatoria sp. CS-180]
MNNTTEFIQEVVRLTNEYRADNGLWALSFDDDLAEAAQTHSENMAEQDFFSHKGKDNTRSWDRARAAGYETGMVGENIAAGYVSPQSVVDAWIKSDGHRANLLNEHFNEIGVGYFYLEDDTGEVNYKTYWAQVFGKGEIETTANELASGGASGGASIDSFDPYQYAASNPDILQVYGFDPAAWRQHYKTFGEAEGRHFDRFDVAGYLASNTDLLDVVGFDLQAGVEHYTQHGFFEGRSTDHFQESQYLASYDDLIENFGYDLEAATQHFIQWGHFEGRTKDSFDEALYLASNSDLIAYFGYALEAVTQHYIQHGMTENRSTASFDPISYLNKYGDLQAAFGNDLGAATQHYINVGFSEGRSCL